MKFVEMRNILMEHFQTMVENNSPLFETDADKDTLWSLYLDSFSSSANPLFRKRTEHDCSCCRHFIKTLGGVVTVKNGKMISLWDFDIPEDDTYGPSIMALRAYVHSCTIINPFIAPYRTFGDRYSRTLIDDELFTFDHFYLPIPTQYVECDGHRRESRRSSIRDTRNVFKRSLEEISEEAVNIVLELISQGSLYRGEEHKGVLEAFARYQCQYKTLPNEEKELYTWEHCSDVGEAVGRIRNHSIGTLLVNISEGMELDDAVKKYEAIVAPSNYKRPKAIFTKRMLEDAKNTISEMGYMDSLKRRYATLDDITVNNILFSNKDSAKRISGADVFEEMAATIAVNPKKFNKVEEVFVDDFIENILPSATEIELFLENKLAPNMVSLIGPKNKDSKTMFKWSNNFCWAYTGNITDSMKERVKAAGGNVTGDLRFSIQWNEDGHDNCDLDAHCIEPNKNEIFFGHCRKPERSKLGGQLDVDIIRPNGKIAVENITWPNRDSMMDGTYSFFVHQYSGSAHNGFRAEIEFYGQIYSFNYTNSMRTGECVYVADVILKNGEFTIKSKLPESSISSRDIWNLHTNQFIPVSVVMYSPNYWDNQNGIGNKHYFFMLKDCINPECPNGFYNEYLNNELDKHKRVMEALGSKLAVVEANDQLSGVGFSSTKHNSVILKVKGNTERVIKVLF